MEIIYFLIPLSILLVLLVIGVLFWAIQSGQYEDMDGPSNRILMDDDSVDPVDKDDQCPE